MKKVGDPPLRQVWPWRTNRQGQSDWDNLLYQIVIAIDLNRFTNGLLAIEFTRSHAGELVGLIEEGIAVSDDRLG